jgi:hypothetical protein
MRNQGGQLGLAGMAGHGGHRAQGGLAGQGGIFQRDMIVKLIRHELRGQPPSSPRAPCIPPYGSRARRSSG